MSGRWQRVEGQVLNGKNRRAALDRTAEGGCPHMNIWRTETLPFAVRALGHLYLPFAFTLSRELGVAIFHAQAYIPT